MTGLTNINDNFENIIFLLFKKIVCRNSIRLNYNRYKMQINLSLRF